jgi:hypothetical protein
MNRALPSCLVLVLALTAAPSVAFADPPSPAAIPAAPATPTRTTVALVSAGIAVAAATTATVFGVLALQNKNDFQSSATYARADDGNNDAAYADGGFALAVAAGVTSLVLYLTRDAAYVADPTAAASKKPGATVSASPLVAPHGGGASALLTF